MSFVSNLYHFGFKRTSSFALFVIGGAFVFENVFDQGIDRFFAYRNKGVSKIYGRPWSLDFILLLELVFILLLALQQSFAMMWTMSMP